jgi:hypothetical protein
VGYLEAGDPRSQYLGVYCAREGGEDPRVILCQGKMTEGRRPPLEGEGYGQAGVSDLACMGKDAMCGAPVQCQHLDQGNVAAR